jgi:hypothetical protein
MMYACTLHRYIALIAKALDGGIGRTRMDDQSFHLAQGTTPHPPGARVTATAKRNQKQGLNFRVDWTGFPTL